MLVKKQGPDGPYLLREKYDAGKMTAPQREIERVAGWRDQMSFAKLLDERGGPFEAFVRLGRASHDGKSWERFRNASGNEWCVDVEVKDDGSMGAVVGVPPDEAWTIALESDEKRSTRVVMES